MIELNQKPDVGWNALFGVSLVGIAFCVWIGFVEPSVVGQKAPSHSLSETKQTTLRARDKSAADLHKIQDKTWDVGVEALGSTVLDYVNGVSEKAGVQMTGFRSDKPNEVANLIEAPFIVIVEGGFSEVLAFERALEADDSKLAVNQIQFTASDSGPGRVTATLGLVGFKLKEAH